MIEGDTHAETARTMSRLERRARVLLVGLMILAVWAGVMVAIPRGPDFEVGTCLSGVWSDETGGTLTSGSCAASHDYRVVALADDEASCPSGTAGHLAWSEGGFARKTRFMCLVAE